MRGDGKVVRSIRAWSRNARERGRAVAVIREVNTTRQSPRFRQGGLRRAGRCHEEVAVLADDEGGATTAGDGWSYSACGDCQRRGSGSSVAGGVTEDSAILEAVHGGDHVTERQGGAGSVADIAPARAAVSAELPLYGGRRIAAGRRRECRRLAGCYR